MGEAVAVYVLWAELPGAKVLRASRGRARERASGVPLLPSKSSTPWSSGRHVLGRLETLPHDRSDLDPRFGCPREGARRRGNQDAFHPPRTRRVAGAFRACHVGRPQSISRHAAPSRGEVALQSRGRASLYRFVLRCLPLDEASIRNGSSNLRAGSFSLPDPRPAAAPPKVSTIDSARGLAAQQVALPG